MELEYNVADGASRLHQIDPFSFIGQKSLTLVKVCKKSAIEGFREVVRSKEGKVGKEVR